MSENNSKICHDLAMLEVIQRLNNEYKGVTLSKGQIYALYQKFYKPEDFEEIVGLALAEELP